MRSSSLRSRIYQQHRHEIILDSDQSHCEAWKEEKKPQQRELVQMVQIDQILHGVIRERMFGNIINKKEHLLAQAYGDIERSTIDTFAGWEITNARRMTAQSCRQSPTKPTTSAFRATRPIKLSQTIGQSSFKVRRRPSRQSVETNYSPRRQRRSIGESVLHLAEVSDLPQLALNNSSKFQDFFRKLVNLPQRGILVEAKVTKQQLKLLFKQFKLHAEFLDRFFSFFDVPAILFFRQFITHMETVVNKTTLREVNFLVFQMLDRDNDGFVSVSDLFRFLGENGGAGILIEKDVFTCSGLIQQKRQKVSLSWTLQSDNKEVKTDEILICNHSIRLDTYRQLVKEDNKQLIACPAMKSTIYHQTFQAIEHNPTVRLKNYHLEQNQSESNLIKKDSSAIAGQNSPADQMNLEQFYRMFSRDRPNIFYFIVETLTGYQFDHIHS